MGIISKHEYLKDNKKPDQENVWNNIAKPWKKYVANRIPIVEEFLRDKKGIIIDIGCGAGRNMTPANDIYYYGVDFSENQLKNAKKYAKKNKINAKFFKLRVNKLPFKDCFFDYGIFIGSLHCIESESERVKSLKEFYRILKKGASSLISVWNSEDKRFANVNNRGEIYMSWSEKRIPYMRYYYLYTKKEILELIKKIGFKTVKIYGPREHDRFSKKNFIIEVKK